MIEAQATSCDVQTDCSGHATTVALKTLANGTVVCNCACRGQWSGHNCGNCPSNYNTSSDCSSCAYGYGQYPECIFGACNNLQDCNNRAITEPTGNRSTTGCQCLCANAFTGSKCETCPSGVDQSMNCGACHNGYTGYPACSLKCTAANCSFHATTFIGTAATGCSCTCRNAWSGPNCSVCPNFFNPDPDCVTCLPGYAGAACTTRVCDVVADCSDHALGVSGDPGSCQCQCRNQWSGGDCSVCRTGLNAATDCDRCVSGFGPFPICAPACTNAGNCSGHATAVAGFQPNCSCSCGNKWTGADCSVCPDPFAGASCNQCKPGFSGYPNCALACTVEANCSGNAGSVSGNSLTGCVCSCRNEWSGGDCSVCAANYNTTSDCGSCAAGFDSYPGCYRTCNNSYDCNGHATSVSGNVHSGCQCSCYSIWRGGTCALCPDGLNTTADPSNPASLGCDRCISGYSGFPACSRTCDATDCSNHASAVSGSTPNCNCDCRNQWKGSSCDVCGLFFNSSDDCGSCAGDAFGYPNCTRACSVAPDCNNNANHVTGTLLTGCTCSCRNSWTGATCNQCAAQFDSNNDCGACAPGYGGNYPNCIPVCTNSADCNNRAINVTGLRPTCSCFCKDQWTGDKCQSCPSQFHQSLCRSCASGFDGYPNCSPRCTVARDCNNNANSVTGTLNTGCSCSCSYQWQGSNCSFCPAIYDASRDCRYCAAGRVGYPGCALSCPSAAAICSGHGNVIGDQTTGCSCNCRNQWNGTDCSVCPTLYNANSDCGACAPGYTNYPNCYRICTVDEDCNGNAISVSGHVGSGCTCTCRSRWRGYSCEFCQSRYNASDDCNSCAVASAQPTFPRCYFHCSESTCPQNRTRYQPTWLDGNQTRRGCRCDCENNEPACSSGDPSICMPGWPAWNNCSIPNDKCEIILDCSGTSRASAVSGYTQTGCNCTCRYGWTSQDCSECPIEYDASRSCRYCARGYSGTFPACYKNCDVFGNCSSNAVSVTGNYDSGCNCNCRNQWFGSECEMCPANVNASEDCGSCVVGTSGYPNCSPTCTIARNCSGNAYSVTGTDRTGCSCSCNNQWSGADCSFCPGGVNPALDCGACQPGFDGYPSCSPICTIVDNCNSNAVNVSGIVRSGCNCVCRNGWTGSRCQTCPPNTNASDDCGSCIEGYHGFPNACVRTCSLQTDCSNNAVNVTGDGSVGCSCTCRNGWSGLKCDMCPIQYNVSQDCGACADRFTGTFPVCLGACNISYHCNGNADSVTGDTSNGCVCSCRNQWVGSRCSSCPFTVQPGTDCSVCASGYTGAPYCQRQCTTALDCSGNARGVTGISSWNTTCNCQCSGSWSSSDCSVCPRQYDPAQNCVACAANYAGRFPLCFLKCNVIDNCSNHAFQVTGDSNTGCTCSCSNSWYGDKCDQCSAKYDQLTCSTCLPGFEDFPNCYRSCTVADDCSGNAHNVTGNNNTGCLCACSNQWTASDCSFCAPEYLSTTCASCRPGLSNYPVCNRQCSSALDCNGHALTVSGTTQADRDGADCTCNCRNSWYGDRCDMCPANIDTGKDCGFCNEGYDTYPSCYLTCTGRNNCSNHASRVVGNTNTGCQCTCINQWYGSKCELCPQGIDSGNSNCGACLSDYTGYPNCSRDCFFKDCSFHAVEVTGNTFDGCGCTCRNQWRNASCGFCSGNFDASRDCAVCAVGFVGIPPSCSRPCNIREDCYDHAVRVTGDWGNCSCQCRNNWAPPFCETCPWPYDPAQDCNNCLPFFDGFPNCKPTCEISRNCTGHASSVNRESSGSCTCQCNNLWQGPDCSVCGAGGNFSNNCLPNGETPAPPTSSTSSSTTTTSTGTSTTTSTSTQTSTTSSSTTTTATSTSSTTTATSTPTPQPTTATTGSSTTTTTTTQAPTTATSSSTTSTTTSLTPTPTTLPSTSISTSAATSSSTAAPTTASSSTTTTFSSTPTMSSSATSSSTPTTQPTSTSTTTVTSATTTTTPAPPSECNVQTANCGSSGGAGASVNPNNQKCECNCKKGFVAVQAADQSKGEVKCACERHVRAEITLPSPNPSSSISVINTALVADLSNQVRSCLSNSRFTSMQASVFKIERTKDAASRDAMKLNSDLMVMGMSGDCSPVTIAADCVQRVIQKDCRYYPKTLDALGNLVVNSSCFVVASAMITGPDSPCPELSSGGSSSSSSPSTADTSTNSNGLCPFAAAVDDASTAPNNGLQPNDDDDGAPIGLIVGIIAGVLILLAVLLYLKKKVFYNGGARRMTTFESNDPNRFNKTFNPAEGLSESNFLKEQDPEHHMDQRPGRCNTQFLAAEMMEQAGSNHQEQEVNHHHKKKKKKKDIHNKSPSDSKETSSNPINLDDDDLMSPKEAPQQQPEAAPASQSSSNQPAEADDMYQQYDAQPRRKRGITMSFI